MNERAMRQLYIELQVGDKVEIVHHIKIGFKTHATNTAGVLVKKERRRSGMDGGFARNWDDKYWFDHLLLQKTDGELTGVTIDEYTDLRRLGSAVDDD